MDFNYLEPLAIKGALEFTEKKNKELNFDCILKKINSILIAKMDKALKERAETRRKKNA